MYAIPGTVDAFPLHALDRAGAPVWTATRWPEDGPGEHGTGYGPSDELALRSARGELAESIAVARALRERPRTHGSWAELSAVYGEPAVLDPRATPLPAGSDWTEDRRLDWLEAEDHHTGEIVLVPVELVASTPAEAALTAPLFTPVTNGLGAGDTPQRALAHGVLELVQRDGNATTYRALDRGIAIDPDAVADATVRALLGQLEAVGIEVLPKLASDDWGMANVYVVGWDADGAATHPLMATSCGEAAHPDRDVALGKALREYLSSRVRKAFSFGSPELVARVAPESYARRARGRRAGPGEGRASAAMAEWLALPYAELRDLLRPSFHAVRRTVAFSTLPTTPTDGDPGAVLHDVAGRLRDGGLRVLFVPLSGPEDEWDAVKAIVPGLEVETATYHRLGPRGFAKLEARDLGLVGRGRPPSSRARAVLAPPAAGLEDAWLDVDALDRIVGPLYPLYREPDRHALWP